eukprot:Skav231040  [mRNA]  locus=scaffold446:103647:104692:+ [translate_table: standard]
MTDRFCVAAQQALKAPHSSLVQQGSNATSRLQDLQGLSLAPELLVQCDEQNHGCSGGRLDDAWIYLKHHGIPKDHWGITGGSPPGISRGSGSL